MSTTERDRVVVKTRFRSSRLIHVPLQVDEFLFDPIPCPDDHTEAILKFEFLRKPTNSPELDALDRNIASEAESRMWLSFLSLVAATNVTFQGTIADNQNASASRLQYGFSKEPPIEPDLLRSWYEKLARLRGRDRARFVNSARAFQAAVSQMDSNPTVSFFLSVVAIECLSNYFVNAKGSRQRFVEFVSTYLEASLSDEKNDLEKFKHRLDTAYRIRNAFVHRGQTIPPAVAMADKFGLPSAIYYDNGVQRRAPGLVWLQKIVRASLLGFLSSRAQGGESSRKPVFRTLARRTGFIRLKLKKGFSVRKGDPITVSMLELD